MNDIRLANDQDCAKRLTLSDRGSKEGGAEKPGRFILANGEPYGQNFCDVTSALNSVINLALTSGWPAPLIADELRRCADTLRPSPRPLRWHPRYSMVETDETMPIDPADLSVSKRGGWLMADPD